ncbi:hypothetical protein [Agaribacter flavus]|uniref:Lipoprotein n=1 Tax=Agaribacter flavus TaxID=1902781 RepID=A0ABV7FTR3_9ALTE
MKNVTLILFIYFTSLDVLACSFMTGDLFKPNLERWEQHPGPAQLNENQEGDYWEPVPRPVISDIQISRASYKGNSSCDDAGIISFKVQVPESSTYELTEFGVYFHIIEGDLPDMIFPNIPLTGILKEEGHYFVFPWLDHRPSMQRPLNLTVEARFISNGLDLGNPSIFKIEQSDG